MPVESSRISGRKKRLLIGIVVLLAVDVIWVLSAELSEHIFHKENFDKPFFTTYLKTSMLIVYLCGFAFMKRWQYQCMNCATSGKATRKVLKEIDRISRPDTASTTPSGLSTENVSHRSSPVTFDEHFTAPTYENMTDDDLSINESEDQDMRKVSFSHVREVRSLARQHSEAQVLARMSQNSVDELQKILTEVNEKLSLQETTKLSLLFVVLWVFATLMYQEALALTSAAVTNILSATSGIFTMVLATLFPSSISDKFTMSKFLAVGISFAGIFIVCWTDPNRKVTSLNFGEIYALLGAILYACYLVLVRRKVGDDIKLDIPLFFGFVGLFGMVIFWPGFFILHYTHQEQFELPTSRTTWGYLMLNATVGTVLSELLWLWGCFLTSSLMATLSLGLVIPMSMAWDMLVNKIKFSWLFMVGTIPVILSFIAVSILTHFGDWDPVEDFMKKLFSCLFGDWEYIKIFFRKFCCCKQVISGHEENKRLLEEESVGGSPEVSVKEENTGICTE